MERQFIINLNLINENKKNSIGMTIKIALTTVFFGEIIKLMFSEMQLMVSDLNDSPIYLFVYMIPLFMTAHSSKKVVESVLRYKDLKELNSIIFNSIIDNNK